jgi:CHAT domain-containing protein/tetratricopeptide (TPR) repeat protein
MERSLFSISFIIFFFCLPFHAYAFQEDSLRIDQLNKNGRQLASSGDFDGAENAYLAILRINPNSFMARNNLGNVYKYLGRYDEALSVFFEAEEILIKEFGQNCPYLAKLYMNIGIIYKLKQDYELALQYLNYAEGFINTSSSISDLSAKIYINLGNIYFGLKDWRKALASYQKGIQMKKALKSGGLDICYANCATAYENLGLLDSARLYYNYSIQDKIDAWGISSYKLIQVYNHYSWLLQSLDEDDMAFQYLREALSIAQEYYPVKHPITSECYKFLGYWYLADGDIEEAIKHFHNAVTAVVFDYSNNDYFDNPGPDNEIISEPVLMEAFRGKAAALAEQYRQTHDQHFLMVSLETLELANMLGEKMRSTYLGQESKLLITENSRIGFDMAINTAFELYKITGEIEYANKAFILAEKSKSSVLLASLQEVENKKNLGIPMDLQNFEQDLRAETDGLKKKLYEERQREIPDSLRLGTWQGKLLSLSQQLDSLANVINEEFPEYASKYNNEVIDLAGVMNELRADQALLEYTITDTSLFIFVIKNDNYDISRHIIDSGFFSMIDILSRFLRNNDFANNTISDYKAYTTAAYSLYTYLFLPVLDQLADKALLIVPDGQLGYIPFEALLTDLTDNESMDYRSLPYLIYKYRTNYSYSATLLFSDNKSEEASYDRLLAFAPTYENLSQINSDKFPAYRDYSTYLVPLKYTSQEIENIGALVECDKYELYEATEQAFRDQAPYYDILHLAMHTLINDDNPMYSQLVFTLNNDTIEENDGLLNTYEIFNMTFRARMTVLSACNTGYGKLRKGEGIMSLARGFIFAGIPTIIMTLWAVEDQSGSVLMSSFYKNLVDGMEIDEALREAKLQYLKNADQLRAHPYLWSGYVSIGATRPLMQQQNSRILILITGILGLVVMISLLLACFKKK